VLHFYKAIVEHDRADPPLSRDILDPGAILRAHVQTLSSLIRTHNLKFGFSPELWDQKKEDAQEPKISVYAVIPGDGAAFVMSLDELESTSFILAAAAALRDLNDSEVQEYHRDVLQPINELGELQFEHEKAVGKLGPDAPPRRWRGAFVLDR